ncbi:unnamed protein product, partial [Cyprideis torosa]
MAEDQETLFIPLILTGSQANMMDKMSPKLQSHICNENKKLYLSRPFCNLTGRQRSGTQVKEHGFTKTIKFLQPLEAQSESDLKKLGNSSQGTWIHQDDQVPSTIRSSIRERSEEISSNKQFPVEVLIILLLSVSGHEVDEMRGDQFIESTTDHEERELRMKERGQEAEAVIWRRGAEDVIWLSKNILPFSNIETEQKIAIHECCCGLSKYGDEPMIIRHQPFFQRTGKESKWILALGGPKDGPRLEQAVVDGRRSTPPESQTNLCFNQLNELFESPDRFLPHDNV